MPAESVLSNMGRAMRLFFAVYAALIINFIVFYIWGSGGVLDCRVRLEYRQNIERNILDLDAINMLLRSYSVRIRNDGDMIALIARGQGLYSENEGLIDFPAGKPGFTVPEYTSTPPLRLSARINPFFIRIVSAFLGIAVYLFLGFVRRKPGGR